MNFDRILSYLSELQMNNNRTWFHDTHDRYELAKKDFEQLLELLRDTVSKQAPSLAACLADCTPKTFMYRVARDVRYSGGREPYHPSFRARIAADRHILLPLGYYIRIAPGDSGFGTGVYADDAETMTRIRDFLLDNGPRLIEIVENGKLPLTGEKLRRVPAKYSKDHPMAELLKYKSWYTFIPLDDRELGAFDDFCGKIGGLITRMEPFRLFMMEALQEKRKEFVVPDAEQLPGSRWKDWEW